jgi:hypothetical protein
MKKILATLAAFATFGASAAPATLLPPGPIYLKFSGQEQIAINGAHTWSDNKEINWGVFVISSLAIGDVATPHNLIDQDEFNPAFFNNASAGSQITGMFYGIEQGGASSTNAFPGTGGYLDLYWRDLSKMTPSSTKSSSIDPSIRCGYDCATGFTGGDLLVRLKFDTGMDSGNSSNTIVGSQTPSAGGFSGLANSYASVDMSHKGLWSDQLNSDWFLNNEGARDLRFRNSYEYNSNWNSQTNANILGAKVDDPGQAYALPEPGALSLMGLALIGMGAVLRRRSRK